jgi:dethiobiotin synthetase
MKGFFITGTGTGVGKTIVTIIIGLYLKSHGYENMIALKPIESGCKKINNVLTPHDGSLIKEILGLDVGLDVITPIRYSIPLAPMAASEIEGNPFDKSLLLRHIKEVANKYDHLLIEGIGGLMVPITDKYFVYNLIKDIKLPVIIVAGAGLGTINHTLMSVDFALNNGINVAGVIINNCSNDSSDESIASNPKIIRELSPAPVIGCIPYLEGLSHKDFENAVRCIDKSLLKYL